MINRNRTPSKPVCYGLYLYFSDLSLRQTSERLASLVKRNHVSIRNWIQKYHPLKLSNPRMKISKYVVDETLIKVCSQYIWIWVTIESENREFSHQTYPKKETCLLGQDSWKTPCINGWWNLVSIGF